MNATTPSRPLDARRRRPAAAPSATPAVPRAAFTGLETLWVQVTGTLCNLRCTHCFISCSPDNESLAFMSRRQIADHLKEAGELGVKEVYFTGGEPLLHPDIFLILADSLALAPTTVLTNGVLITERFARRLGELAAAAAYSLEVRVSLDAPDEEVNDAIRGPGVFRKALRGLQRLHDNGLLPIVTATELVLEQGATASAGPPADGGDTDDGGREVGGGVTPEGRASGRTAGRPLPAGVDAAAVPPPPGDDGLYRRFHDVLLAAGIERPRVKLLPVFNMGMLEGRGKSRLLEAEMLAGFDTGTLQCSASRLVAEDGVYACPILAGEPEARMSSDALATALDPCALYHPSCTTCYLTGMTCRNY